MTKRTCSTPECSKPHYGRGWCRYHYQKAYLAGELEAQPRTLARPTDSLDTRLRNIGWTVTESGCWEFMGSKDSLGYGQMAVNRGRPWRAYRIAYEAWVKVPEPNVDICHRCDNPPCINPAHLFEGTRKDNIDDMVAKKRHRNGENKKNHKLTDVEVQQIKDLYASGLYRHKDLAEMFGVSSSLISMLIAGKRRKEPTFRRAA
jgi:hypothetical protein